MPRTQHAPDTAPEPEVTDFELLAAWTHRGDQDAFRRLVDRHGTHLHRVALGIVGSDDDAADVVQTAWVDAARSAARFRGDAAVTTWLYRITHNAGLDLLRRRSARPPTVPLPEGDDLHRTGDLPGVDRTVVDRVLVAEALAQLRPAERDVVVLVWLEDLPVAEAARVLGIPPGTVKSRCARARARMAHHLVAPCPDLGEPTSSGPQR